MIFSKLNEQKKIIQIKQYFLDIIQQEYNQLIIWIPVLFGAGIVIYFFLAQEPSYHFVMAMLANILVILLIARKKRPVIYAIALISFIIMLGFANIFLRTYYLATPILAKDNLYEIIGIVENIDNNFSGKQRLIIRDIEFVDKNTISANNDIKNNSNSSATSDIEIPVKIRINVRTKMDNVEVGDKVSLLANLTAPPRPVLLNSYNFRRHAYFNKIGAVGYSLSDITIIEKNTSHITWFMTKIKQLRNNLADNNQNILGIYNGSIASALMVGQRYAIPDEILENIRVSGIAHLLAISGLHIVIVCGFCFLLIRKILSLNLFILERINIKKFAAIFGILIGLFYLLLTGSPISAQRAFIMIALVFTAVLFDRNSSSIFCVAWAAMIILLLQPETVITPGFQMSFAAAVSLISAYEYLNKRYKINDSNNNRFYKFLGNIKNIILSTMIATLATSPFAIYHFNNYSIYSLLTNIIAVPLTSIIIMPLAIISILLYFIGISFLTLVPMGYAIELLLLVSNKVAHLPHAKQSLPEFSPVILGLITISGLWLCLLSSKIRFIGAPLIVIGYFLIFNNGNMSNNKIIISPGRGAQYAIIEDNNAIFSDIRKNSYKYEIFSRRLGIDNDLTKSNLANSQEFANYKCDKFGCAYEKNGLRISFVKDIISFIEDCKISDIIVNYTYLNADNVTEDGCKKPQLIINRYDLSKLGTHVIIIKEADSSKTTKFELQHNFITEYGRPWN
ncbi:MAG: ComEC/Rec2 family competence protein [Pseudomonadota bacterium]